MSDYLELAKKVTEEVPAEDTRKAEAFKSAVAWIANRGGPAATLAAFGDAGAINEVWEHWDLEGFQAYFWERCETALFYPEPHQQN